jgi:hypothetical protein
LTGRERLYRQLNNGGVLGIYPEGTRIKNGYDENNAKPGIALIANKAKVKIMPVYVEGPYKFRGKINLYIGKEKDYLENYSGKIDTEKYTEAASPSIPLNSSNPFASSIIFKELDKYWLFCFNFSTSNLNG